MEDYSGLMAAKLAMLRSLVAQPVTTEDPQPCVVGDSILVGNKFHVTQPALLSRLGVTAVLNCAPSGIRNLPLDDYEEWGIKYHFTNCARDDENYPILHNRDGLKSTHLEKAQEVYAEVKASGGKVLFNCAAGQNRSATLAVAVQVCSGVPLAESAVKVVSETSVGAIVTTITLSALTVASLRSARSSSARVARTSASHSASHRCSFTAAAHSSAAREHESRASVARAVSVRSRARRREISTCPGSAVGVRVRGQGSGVGVELARAPA